MNVNRFSELLEGINNQQLVKATLSAPRNGDEKVVKITMRPIAVKAGFLYQLSEHAEKQVTHRNLSSEECAAFVQQAFERYGQGLFFLHEVQYQVLINKQGHMTVLKKAMVTAPSPITHNRVKSHVLQEGIAVPFLVALGIMTAEGKVIAKKYDKFRQINRFLEMVRDIMEYLPKSRCLEVVDFGCGKAYLTFALYYYLRDIEKRDVHIVGIDLKQEVVAACQRLADQLGLDGLKFFVGDIHDFESRKDIDLMISLHACNTATDAALDKAVRWNAGVILCVPCCQHELYSQIKNPAFDALLRHGILKERLAALATDAARADLLTMCGYEVQIMEFIDMEHTPKNLLLRAVKGVSEQKKMQAETRYFRFKGELGIIPSLETKLKDIAKGKD